MEGGAFRSDEILPVLGKFVPLLHVTTRIDGRADDELLFDLGENTFPTVLVLDAAGGRIAKHRGPMTVAGFTQLAAAVARHDALVRKVATGDASAAIDLALIRAELGAVEVFEVEERLADKELNEEQRKRMRCLLALVATDEMTMLLRKQRWKESALAIAGEELAPFAAERIEPGPMDAKQVYWRILARWSIAQKDATLLARAIERQRALYGDNRAVKKRLALYERELQRLRANAK